jgi:hypothetical protein
MPVVKGRSTKVAHGPDASIARDQYLWMPGRDSS